jgi:hypothetical protein
MKKVVILCCCALMLWVHSGCTKSEYNSFATLYGVITDHATGKPVSNASVVLSPSGKTQVTGDDGIFTFNDLDPQQYTITVQKTGYQTNRKTVTAVVGEETEANIPLTATTSNN